MDTYQCVRTRRTVREYSEEPVEEATVRRVLEAGRLAPSARNLQPWHFVVVRRRETLAALEPLCTTGRFVSKAAFAVVMAVDPQNPYHAIDAGRAAQQMELAAWNEAVGMCWIGQFDEEGIRRLLGIPPEWKVMTVLAFGRPLRPPRPPKKGAKKPFNEVVSWERW